jgi:glucose-1-phosphate cytidylyltransferase
MKVVLFCGGFGLRLREHSETVPKPMVPIANRPVIWYVMKYYAHFGHKDFILCLGHQAGAIKKYFREYDETLTNDFVIDNGELTLSSSDISDWRITFADTGLKANVGERLMAVKKHLEGEDMFLVNYADVLTDAHLPDIIGKLHEHPDAIGSMLSVKPGYTFHILKATEDDPSLVSEVTDIERSDLWIDAGYFAFRKEIFDYMEKGDDLVVKPFERLIEKKALRAHRHSGFWAPMDTLKEKLQLEAMYESGNRPWCIWENE